MTALGKRTVVLFLGLATLGLIWFSLAVLDLEPDAKGTGFAPNFGLGELSGRRFYLSDHRRGVVVMVFWQTTCSVCKEEMVFLSRLAKDDTSFTPVAVCTDPQNASLVRQIAAGLNIQYPVLLDVDGRVARKYEIKNYPTTVVVNREGHVAFRREGYDEHVQRRLQMIVKGAANR